MIGVENNISEFENYLFLVLENLDEINDENFEDKMVNIKSLIEQIEEKRVYLKNNFSKEILKEKSDVAHRAIKQIKAKFDDVIEDKNEKKNTISLELNQLANKKKLINYQR